MKHYGDITKLSGYVLPIVDVITGGSPCQDLSVAGKRAGLAGKRSGLFMEQMRIVKEMRERDVRDNGRTGFAVRPRYMVWENVPGAFSSGNPKGADFAAVIEEIIKVAEPDASVSVCVPNGGWTKSGCYYAEDGSWSVAWRVHDAQFWGVPQRRKRIALVADFGGLSAPEILFERKGLSRDPEPGAAARKRTAGATGSGVEGASVKVFGISAYESNAMKSPNPRSGIYEAETARTLDLNGGSPACNQGGVAIVQGSYQEVTGTLNPGAHAGSYNGQDAYNDMLIAYAPDVAHSLHAKANCQFREDAETYVAAVDCRNATGNADVNGTLQAKEQWQNLNSNNVCRVGSVVRRLTPLECERLQGYPDGWTDIGEWTDSKGKKHKDADSPRYKALGNSIALPFWAWLARRICAQYERPATMASLFDGIGGFPLVFQRSGAVPVWASEIEEFPIAVTKKHFPEE